MVKGKEEDKRITLYLQPDVQEIIAEVKPKSTSKFFNDCARMQYRWQYQILSLVETSVESKMASFREEIKQLLIDCHEEQDAKISEIKNMLINDSKSESKISSIASK